MSLFAVLGFLTIAFGGQALLSLTATPPEPDELLATAAAEASPVEKLRMCRKGEKNTAIKTGVVDGDTPWLRGTDDPMKDYDTPETQTDICGGASEVALGRRAGARFLELLNSNHWTIETFGVDRTGRRVLATIRIAGRDVGDILIAEHLARRWPDGREFWCS